MKEDDEFKELVKKNQYHREHFQLYEDMTTSDHEKKKILERIPESLIKKLKHGEGSQNRDFKTFTPKKASILASSGLSLTEINNIVERIMKDGMTERDVIREIKRLKGELKEKTVKEPYQEAVDALTRIAKKYRVHVTSDPTDKAGSNGGEIRRLTLDPIEIEKLPEKKKLVLAPFSLGKDEAPTLEDAKKWAEQHDGKVGHEENDYWIVYVPDKDEEENEGT